MGKEGSEFGLTVGQVGANVLRDVLIVDESLLAEDCLKFHEIKGVRCWTLLRWVFLIGVDDGKILIGSVSGEIIIGWFGWGVKVLR